MFHTRKATIPLDKVYALLGMSSDNPHRAGFAANYASSWKDIFQRLVYFCLSDQMSVSIWDDMQVAVIEAKGCILGEVTSSEEDASWDDRQHVEITWKPTPSHSDAKGERSSRFASQASAKAIEKGDVVCLLQGASGATIIRPCNGFSTIIRIAGLTADRLPKWSASLTNLPNDILLVWDWDESRRESQEYGKLIGNRGVPMCPMTQCRCLNDIDEAI